MGSHYELVKSGIEVTEELANKEIFENYQSLGGEHGFELFVKNLDEFYSFTFDSYVLGMYVEGGPDSQEEAWDNWVAYIGSYEEASRYFEAVDNFSPYT